MNKLYTKKYKYKSHLRKKLSLKKYQVNYNKWIKNIKNIKTKSRRIKIISTRKKFISQRRSKIHNFRALTT